MTVEEVFATFEDEAIAAASIGQVHRATLPSGEEVAVKVQYPGVDKAIKSDLDNAEMMYGLFASFALRITTRAPEAFSGSVKLRPG